MTTPNNTVAGLAEKWREAADDAARTIGIDKTARAIALTQCADELAAALSGVSAPVGVEDHVRRQVGRLAQWSKCMSHNESYFGEPAGLVKSVTDELSHAVDPIYPPIVPPADPLAGVTIHTATLPLTRGECSCPQHGGWIAANDVKRLTREIDIAINGEEGAAEQASLCDVAAQIKRMFTTPAASEDGLPSNFDDGGPYNGIDWQTTCEALQAEVAELRRRLAASGQRVPALDDDVRWILGRPNFACNGIANTLRRGGRAIAPKSEDEQANVLHYLLTMYARHGAERWRDAVEADLKAMDAAAPTQEKGND